MVTTTAGPADRPLTNQQLQLMHAYWRACNYLSVGMIYLKGNPLLREPLKTDHVKHRLLGHWGTSPGLNLLYVHLNRLITAHDINMMLLAGPGHGGPAIVGNVYLEGTYSEIYPDVSQDVSGLRRLYLRRVSAHHYTFPRDAVTIRAFWHAKRGHGPFSQS